jgi:hypothetical protein
LPREAPVPEPRGTGLSSSGGLPRLPLAGFNVTQGNIVVQGDGFNASNIDQADLIARAVQVNAAIYGKQARAPTRMQKRHRYSAVALMTGCVSKPRQTRRIVPINASPHACCDPLPYVRARSCLTSSFVVIQ